MGFSLTVPISSDLWFDIEGMSQETIPHTWKLDGANRGAHCPDCLELAGEVRTLGEWMNSVMPGADCLQCGSGCRCSLQPSLYLPTRYNLFLPFGMAGGLQRSLIFQDGSRLWRYDFTEALHGSRPSALRPGRAPAASLPRQTAADHRIERFIDRRPRKWLNGW